MRMFGVLLIEQRTSIN